MRGYTHGGGLEASLHTEGRTEEGGVVYTSMGDTRRRVCIHNRHT